MRPSPWEVTANPHTPQTCLEDRQGSLPARELLAKGTIEPGGKEFTQKRLRYVESRTNKVALVCSRQYKIYKTKWSHSCQPGWLSVSHDPLVQERNYLSQSKHIWQEDTPKISARVIRTARSAERDQPQVGFCGNSTLTIMDVKHNTHVAPIGSWATPHLASGVPRHLSKRPRRVEYITSEV